MIDVHTHAAIGWQLEDVAESLRLCGFDRAVLAASPLDHWGTELNEGCARIVAAFPDRLVGLIGIHPPDVDQSLRDMETYGRQGFVGLKLMPTVGYYPDDERFRPIFAEANARKWIVLTHCGWCSRGVKDRDLPQSTRFSDPYHLEPLVRIYPDIDFILAHGGGRTFHPRAAELVSYHANVYLDTCPGQGPWVLQHGGVWLTMLDWERVLFGTDVILGATRPQTPYADTAAVIRRLLVQAGYGDHVDAVMHGNAARLLRRHGVAV